jgi:integrase
VAGPDGKRHQARRRGFATKGAAQAELDKIRKAAREQTYVPLTKQTVTEYLTSWLAALPNAGIRATTIDGYRRHLAIHVLPAIGSMKLQDVRPQHLDALYAQLLSSGYRGHGPQAGLSPRTTRYVHCILLKAFGDAVRKDALERNPATAATAPSPKSTRAPEMSWWRPDELRTFLAATAKDPLGPLFRLAAMTGMRRGEVCGLQWDDVDLDASRLTVRRQIVTIDHKLVVSGRTKTDHGLRDIDLDPLTVSTLRAHKARQSALRLKMGEGYRDEGWVFSEANGSPLHPEMVAKVFRRRAARAGVPDIRFHDLRHTHVAHLIAAREQPLMIAKRLGHSSPSFSLARYGHLMDKAGAQAASAVARLVDEASS